MKIPTVDVGDKVKNFVIKLHETHRKEKFMIFMKAGKYIELETFPKKVPERKIFLDYEVCETFKNMSLILYVMSSISYHEFKSPILLWLMQNKYYMTKTIFKSSKDTIVQIGHLTNLNLFCVDRNQYQETINELMEAVSIE
eukprot:14053379-Ditylum_brightwellii.AAC.1